jgi:hypothetical protein
MAAISRSRRSTAGIALIVAGALLVLLALFPLVAPAMTLQWVALLAEAAMVVAYVILALGAVNNTVAKVALFAAAAGWAVIALAGLGIALPAVLITVAVVVAAIAGVVGAIVLYVGKEITNRPALIFVVATALGAIYLLASIGTFAGVDLGLVITELFGAALIVAGVFFRRTEGRR